MHFFRSALGQNFAARTHVKNRSFVEFFHGLDAVDDWLGHHDHAWAPAKGRGINLVVPLFAVGADVVNVDLDFAALDSSFNDAFLEVGSKNIGENGEDVEAHGRTENVE